MAQVLIALGDEDAARRCYQDGCDATGGDNAHLWQAWATLEERAGDVAKARQFYDAALAADKTHAAAWHGWATLEKKQGNFQRARICSSRAFGSSRRAPTRTCTTPRRDGAGAVASKRRANTSARGPRRKPGRGPRCCGSRGRCSSRGSPSRGVARKLFQRALGVDPDNRYVWLAWATFEAKEGVDRARSLLRKGVSSTPDPPLLQALARLEAAGWESRDGARALRAGDQARPGAPGQLAGVGDRGVEGWARGSRARAAATRGVGGASQPQRVQAVPGVGRAGGARGNTQLARQLYKCGVKADPTSETAWLTWALMEEKQGNEIRAAELRNLCVQARAEELVGQSDLSRWRCSASTRRCAPSSRRSPSSSEAAMGAAAESVSEGSVKYGKLRRAEREVVQAEPLFGVLGSDDAA